MAEIYKDSVSQIRTKIFWNNEITNADDDEVYVYLYDVTEDKTQNPLIDPTQIISEDFAVKLENDIGSYYISLSRYYTDRNRKFKLVWNYKVNGLDGSHITYADVVTPYTDLAEAIEDMSLGTDPSDPNYKTYHDLAMAEKYARKAIENYTGQRFSLYDDIITVYGSGSDVLPLPFKLNELHELYGNDILLVDAINEINNWNYPTQVSESGFGLRVNRSNMLDNTVYTANGMVPPSINDSSSGAFVKDYVYRVQGRYGWSEVPDDVQIACVELMKDYFSKDTVWRAKYVNSVQSFDWHFEYNAEAYRGTGNVYADQLLLPYVLTQLMVI